VISVLGTSAITLGLGILSAVLVLTGGIVFFVVGRGRGALAGAGFVILALGTVTGSLLSTFAPVIVREWNMSSQGFSAMFSIVLLLFDLIGWGLVVFAVIALARSAPAPGTAGPGPQPGPPYGQPPGYGPYPPQWGSGHGGPPPGPRNPPPAPGPQSPPPPPGW
jgi:hypothetical protein